MPTYKTFRRSTVTPWLAVWWGSRSVRRDLEFSPSELADRDYAQALFTLSLCYGDPSLTSQQQDRVLPLLDQLAGTVIYSREHHLLQPHTTQPGETLAHIASRYSVPPEFLARVNGLPLNAVLPPGQNLKVVQGPFRGQLDLTRRELTLFLNRHYAGRFVVSVGRDAPAQDMVLQVGKNQDPAPIKIPPPVSRSHPMIQATRMAAIGSACRPRAAQSATSPSTRQDRNWVPQTPGVALASVPKTQPT